MVPGIEYKLPFIGNLDKKARIKAIRAFYDNMLDDVEGYTTRVSGYDEDGIHYECCILGLAIITDCPDTLVYNRHLTVPDARDAIESISDGLAARSDEAQYEAFMELFDNHHLSRAEAIACFGLTESDLS